MAPMDPTFIFEFDKCIGHVLHGKSITIVSQIGPSNPLYNLQNNNFISSLPLFAYKTPHGPHALTKQQLLSYPHTTGHSFQIGGTTELLLSGVTPDIIKNMGRWSSDSFLCYWCPLDDPLYAKNVHWSGHFGNPC